MMEDMWTAGYAYLFGDHEDGCVARTVEAADMNVDLDADGRVIGVETLGADTDWRQALVRLAMSGRLVVR